jgi:hypothetical protein
LPAHAEHDQPDATAIKVFEDPQKVSGAPRQPVWLAESHPLTVFEPSLLTVLGRTVTMSVGVTLAKILTLVGSSVPCLAGKMVNTALCIHPHNRLVILAGE